LTSINIGKIWLSLGANIAGRWGSPEQSFDRAVRELQGRGFAILDRSMCYATLPHGSVRQPVFLNMVISMRGSAGPAALLRLLKAMERRAGRRLGPRWGPRPLDLDILDYGGRILGRPATPRPPGRTTPPHSLGRLVLPHPEMHRRGFVLVPLAAVAPAWRHPRLRAGARQLLGRNPLLRRGISTRKPN
jgi:2-amino-4-hydroxy-6-hydroxymethyldihydropteridine diphosphokinase